MLWVDDLNVWWLGSGMQDVAMACATSPKCDSICVAMCYNNVWRSLNVKEATKESSMLRFDSERVNRSVSIGACQSERVNRTVLIGANRSERVGLLTRQMTIECKGPAVCSSEVPSSQSTASKTKGSRVFRRHGMLRRVATRHTKKSPANKSECGGAC